MGNIKVTIKGSAGAFCADVSAKSHHAKRLEGITWRVKQPTTFPADGVVFVQFDGDGCLIDGAKNHGKHDGSRGPNGHFVAGIVDRNAAQRPYSYVLWYHDSAGDHQLVDPEIVVDGGQIAPPPHGNRHRRGRRELLAKRAHLASRRKELRRARAKKAAKRARR
ncbi:MAG: hypothetical protein ABI024_13995 [Vicinamibacterales bacterium]